MRLTKDEYSEKHIQMAEKYIDDVLAGRVVCNRWVKLTMKRHKKDLKNKKLTFDKKRVDRAFRFFSLLNINIKNKYQQFVLAPFQAFVVYSLFGWYWKHSDKRRFRYGFLYISRKGGKTTFAAALSIYALVADGVVDPQVLMLANTREQAGLCLNAAKSIRSNSPDIQKRVDERQYSLGFKKKVGKTTSTGILKNLASQAHRLDGYSPSFTILDEVHEYVDDSLLRIIKSGTLARDNPLTLMISTAGFQKDSFCFDLLITCQNILKGEVVDESFFALLFMLDEGDDWMDNSLWVKANPNLGTIISMDDMMIEFNQVKTMPSTLQNFLVKNLNIYQDVEECFLEDSVLQVAFNSKLDMDDYIGQDCYVGIDLSSTKDLTSFVYLFYNEDTERFTAFPFFFMAKNPNKRLRKGGIDLTKWIREGHIKEGSNRTIDYDMLFDHFKEIASKHNIMMVGYDILNSALIVPRVESLGIECKAFPQTTMAFNFPMKYLEKTMYDETIEYNNPVMTWNFRNTVIWKDPANENIRPSKKKSLDSIDGVVSMAEAMGMWLHVNLSPELLAFKEYVGGE